jgi:hypothetical protein
MADDDENEGGGGGGGIGGMLGRRIGPLPMYAWLMLAGGAGLIIFHLKGASSSSSSSGTGGTNTGQGNQFSSTSTTSGTDAAGQQYSDSYSAQGNGYLPGQLTYGAGPMPTSAGDVYVNYPATNTTTSSPPSNPNDVINSSGKDVGQYLFGTDQINYLIQNKGKYGITDQIIGDVQKAYSQISSSQGQGQAGMYHYSWMGPGNVQAIPPYVNSTQDIKVNLP